MLSRPHTSTSPSSHFNKSQLPPPRAFYSREFGELRKTRRGWVQTKCCFHEGKSKTSLALNVASGGGFYCFSCGAHGGDILDFYQRRYRVDFKTAAIALGAWDENGRGPTAAERRKAERQRERKRCHEEQQRVIERRKRLAHRDWLHVLERVSDKTSNRLTTLRRGAPEQFPGEAETCWQILADVLPQIRAAEADYYAAAGLVNHG